MEPSQLIPEEWGSLSGLYTAEEADFMTQLLSGIYSVTENHCFGINSNSYLLPNIANANASHLCFSQGSSSTSTKTNMESMSMDFAKFSPHCFQCDGNLMQQMNEINDDQGSGMDRGKPALADNFLQANRECERIVLEPAEEGIRKHEDENSITATSMINNEEDIVDISTMLEEAVQYVRFLQLQIKLLSSDDMWVYAPIGYNGINIGLDLSITPPTKGRS